jgi:hypothetical protein
MDHSARIEALRMAKAIIASHGITFHMNKYTRDHLAREVLPETCALKYDFNLDPTRDSWSSNNPSCSVNVGYVHNANAGPQLAEDGSRILVQPLRVTVSASASDMDIDTLRKREGMISLLSMLCDMLTASLPSVVVSTIETAAEIGDRKQREIEQVIGQEIANNINVNSLKGLRRGGTSRTYRLTEAYTSSTGKYPPPGTYRFRHIRSTDSRGRPREIANYILRVIGDGVNYPPLVTACRLKDDQK